MAKKLQKTREEIIKELSELDESHLHYNPGELIDLLKEGFSGYNNMTNKELALEYKGLSDEVLEIVSDDLSYYDKMEKDIITSIKSYFKGCREYEKK